MGNVGDKTQQRRVLDATLALLEQEALRRIDLLNEAGLTGQAQLEEEALRRSGILTEQGQSQRALLETQALRRLGRRSGR